MELERVNYLVEDRIAILKINNPPANTLGSKTLKDIESAIDIASNDEKIKAIILTGEGKMFVAGADIKEIHNIASASEGENMAVAGQRLFNKIESLKKPVIAAINGACLGGGMELAMACHIRLAAETAKFGQPEINLGLIPGFGGTQRLARLTNKGIALEWILTGDMYSAVQAHQIGLVNKVAAAESLLDEAIILAKKISEKGSIAIAMTIEAVNSGLEGSLIDGLRLEASLFGEICETNDKKEGVQAFIEKRAPVFKDK